MLPRARIAMWSLCLVSSVAFCGLISGLFACMASSLPRAISPSMITDVLLVCVCRFYIS